MILKYNKLCKISFFFIFLVFFLAPINELLISYNLPQMPYFDFYPLLMSVFCLILYLYISDKVTFNIDCLLLLIFFSSVIIVFALSDVIIDSDGQSTSEVNLFFIRKSISYLILGLFCSKFTCSRDDVFYPFFILTFTFISIIDWSTFRLNTFNYPNESQWGNYHYLSECYAIISFWFLSNLNSDKKFTILIVYFISVFILFLLGSRSSLFVYLFVSILLLYKKKCLIISMFSIFLSFFIIMISSSALSLFSNFIDDNYRMFAILISSDEGSAVTRGLLAQRGLEDIKNNWLTGNLGGQVQFGGTLWGGYIHDFRSYWRQFGIIAFVTYCIILIRLNYYNIVNFFIKDNNSSLCFVTLSLLFFTIESIFARAYLSTYIFFFIGYSILNVYKKVDYDS